MINIYPGKQLRSQGSQLWVITTGNPDSVDPQWSAPRLIAMDQNCFNKPVVLADGTWLWPSGAWNLDILSHPILSTDRGASFFAGGEIPMRPEDRDFEEYNVVERPNGELWMLTRTSYGIGESVSCDRGATWSGVTPSRIRHCVSRFFLTRLQSGKLLLVKHGAIGENVGRSKLMAFLSADEGATWSGGLMLDEREDVSYPDGCQSEDGTIFIIYDRGRHTEKEILLVKFSEADVAAAVSAGRVERRLVNKATLFNPRFVKTIDPADS